MIKKSIIFAACILVSAVAAPTARAEWPDHPIRFIVGFGPGGANDLIARIAAAGVSKRLGQTVVIENRPGAGAVIGTAYVTHSPPDGYTFLVGAASTITNSLILKDWPTLIALPKPVSASTIRGSEMTSRIALTWLASSVSVIRPISGTPRDVLVTPAPVT